MSNDNSKSRWGWVIIFFILLFFLIFTIGLYQFSWQGSLTRGFVKIVPFPIARVSWDFISYKEFNENLLFLENYYDHSEERRPQKTSKLVLDKLIQESLIKKLAKKYNITPTEQEIETTSLTILADIETKEKLEKQLAEHFDWSLKKYQKKIVEPYLLQIKLADKISTDEEINKDQLVLAQKVLDEIKTERINFEFAAQTYSQDLKTAPEGGDLSKRALEEFPDQAILAIKDLEINEISDIIKINGGYYIYKLINKDEEANIYEVRQIYFKTKTLAEYLAEFRKEVTIKIYGKI